MHHIYLCNKMFGHNSTKLKSITWLSKKIYVQLSLYIDNHIPINKIASICFQLITDLTLLHAETLCTLLTNIYIYLLSTDKINISFKCCLHICMDTKLYEYIQFIFYNLYKITFVITTITNFYYFCRVYSCTHVPALMSLMFLAV